VRLLHVRGNERMILVWGTFVEQPMDVIIMHGFLVLRKVQKCKGGTVRGPSFKTRKTRQYQR